MQDIFASRTAARFHSQHVSDQRLYDSVHFFCVASLGSLVPGWVLIVPKAPRISLSQITPVERADFVSFTNHIREKVEQAFGPTVMFEHGPNHIGSKAGCGVDQAHLHIVPIAFSDFVDHLPVADVKFRVGQFAWPWQLAPENCEYLWHSDGRQSAIANVDTPQGQFYRRVVAKAICEPEAWDYRRHPKLENLQTTQMALAY